jgi:hypothetical protein
VRCVGDWAASGVGRPRASGLPAPPTGEPGQPPRSAGLRTACLRGRGPLVPVVEATYPTMGVHGGGACRAQVHGTNHRRVLVDPEMRPIPVVVRQVLAEQPPKMLVVENDDVLEQVAPYRPHEFVRPARSATGSGSSSAWARAPSTRSRLTILLGPTASSTPTREAAQRLLDAAALSEIAWASRQTSFSNIQASDPRALPRSPPPSSSAAAEVGHLRSAASGCSTRRGSSS